MRVGDDLGLDGLDVAGVGRRRGGLLRLDARVEEAAAVGELQHRVAAGTAAVPGGSRVQCERQACARRRLRRRRDDGTEGGSPQVVVVVVVLLLLPGAVAAAAACADSEVVGDLLHGSGRISSEVVAQRSSSPPTVSASSCAKGVAWMEMR